MKTRFVLALSMVAVMLTACGSEYEVAESKASNSYYTAGEAYTDDSYYSEDLFEINSSSSARSADTTGEYDEAVGDYGKKLVHNYTISIQTTDFDNAKADIEKKINECGGYIENSSVSNYDLSSTLSMVIRIPQEKAEEFLYDASKSGNVTYQSENTTDKTLEYVDVDSRMKSYKQELEVMEELAKKAESVDELLQIENNIANLRGQIDSYQSQLNSIDNKVSFATISLDLTEVERYSYVKPGFWANVASGLSDSFIESADMIGDFIIRIPVFITGLILFLIPFAIVVFLVVRVIRLCTKKGLIKFKRKKKTDDNSVDTQLKETAVVSEKEEKQ